MPTLNWLGREKMTDDLRQVALRILREDRELSHHAVGHSDNILVHGDNLEALKALLPFYAGRVRCIYIDPPYNTGSAFEHYDDNLEHATWLNMMYPRLKLLREFLREDGSIWISIDDREGAYLRVICDEIFGRQNFVSNVSWQRNYSVKGDSKGIVTSAEHILVYSKREGWQPNKLARTEEMDGKYKNPDNDPNGPWTSGDAFAADGAGHQGMVYAIQHPFTGELIYPYASAHWRYGQEEMLSIMNGWCPYELREIDDAEKRAAICGVGVDEVRKGVKAILLKEDFFNTEPSLRDGATGASREDGATRSANVSCASRASIPEALKLCRGANRSTEPREANLPVASDRPAKRLCVENMESRKLAMAVLKKGPWPKFYFTKNGQGGIRRKTYLSAVGGVPPTNLWLHPDVGHTDEAKKEVLKVFDGQSPFATPKPERLIQRILTIATDAGDLVLDSFLGSGTTAAVAHKMGRRWIGIEMGDHARTHCAVRMRKVVDGEPGGISKAVKWQGGGGFRFYELGEPILKPDGTLTADIPFEVMAAHVWWRETGTPWTGFFNTEPSLRDGATGASREDGSARSANAPCASRASAPEVLALCKGANRSTESREANLPVASDRPAKRLCVEKSPVLGVHGGVAYALLYNGILHDRRVNGGNVLTRKTLALIREDLGEAECDKLIVYGEATRLLRETLAAEKIEFRQTPYDLVFGR